MLKKQVPIMLAMILCGAYPALAQRPEQEHPSQESHPAQAPPSHQQAPPKANQGHVPPPPPKRESQPPRQPENNQANRSQMPQGNRADNSRPVDRQDNRPESHPGVEARQENVRPHVDNDQWYGHDQNDSRYHVARPYEHGSFAHYGQQYRYGVERVDRDHHQFWFPGGYYWQVADWDWPVAADWCWNCGDDFVVYEDPDHPGWYLVYNVNTGEYVHAQYMGS
jgi:hypothetical protein